MTPSSNLRPAFASGQGPAFPQAQPFDFPTLYFVSTGNGPPFSVPGYTVRPEDIAIDFSRIDPVTLANIFASLANTEEDLELLYSRLIPDWRFLFDPTDAEFSGAPFEPQAPAPWPSYHFDPTVGSLFEPAFFPPP